MKPLNQYIDHTNLKANTTQADIQKLCEETIEHHFYSACVPPRFVQFASDCLKNHKVKVCTVIGFPLGYSSTATKQYETKEAIEHGATEIDMVIAVGALKEKNIDYVTQDIQAVLSTCKQQKEVLLKVILETALLTNEEIKMACKICSQLNVDFVKTSTGFSTRGVSLEDIQLMRANLPKTIQIKASGGIKTHNFALELINAGADRLGCSSSIQIINQ